ncbi:unsaturated rhamnogalacturonyl hydrolase [Filimonas lacunae]|uniref:Unsaturated rhamnogalacturonyl hydrolase n=1 Tax=Filimonas lacunae TaxID=477680 RepID=A0A173MAD9_9BACT|nr:glycoside hydrolase family 88 protein [Filimonas lacunae]BAV04524.1 rhamnogalacturonides degradation protein RhiN [Filimonas lacunae]SIT31684.1 unsaturated rhamnogalacturonyl hydrolase [Filimonas lacunae]
MKKNFVKIAFAIAALPLTGVSAQSLSEKLAATVMSTWKDSMGTTPGKQVKWSYDQGVILEGIDAIWERTADKKYFDYIKRSMDHYIDADGNINTYKQEDYNIDNVKNGRSLLTLYKVTGKQNYLKAATTLWQQLQSQPRTKEGGFWHKKIYPNQMWLDGLYMGEPFYTEYAALINDEKAFDDIANQFIWMENHARDAKTGLLYHGWDESKQEQWANKTTGLSPNFWGRAMGWYAMALVDVLDYFPVNHPKRAALLAILGRTAAAIQKHQEASSGLWYQVLDKPQGKGNYHESSAACMFVYAIAKGVRKEYLPASFFKVAQQGYAGIKKEFIEPNDSGWVNLKSTVAVAGLGGKPYRDGSYEYYLKEKVITNDAKGMGAFLLASSEMEIAAMPKPGKGKTVTLDSYFNNEFYKEPATGQMASFHYKWEERDNNGFWFFREAFNYAGAKTNTLYEAPTAANLKKSDVYIIVDADTEKETAKPNYMDETSVKNIAEWVKAGGVLVLLANDAGNAELKKFTTLSDVFGIHFNEDSRNKVTGQQFEMGALTIPAGNPVFATTRKVYIKEISTLQLSGSAKANLTDGKNVLIATAKYGKGTVFAVGDPWFYNEYTDGRKLPAEYQNYQAAKDLVKWALTQTKNKNN